MATDLDSTAISADFIETPLTVVLQTIARRLDCDLVEIKGVWYLGRKKPEDKAVLARRTRRLNPDELQQSAQNFLNDGGRCTVLSDGLLIVADTFATLERINEMIDRVESAPSVTWAIQLHVVSFSDQDLIDFGLDVNPALELAAGYANLSNVTRDLTAGAVQGLRGEGGSSVADASLSAVLRASRERSSMRIVCDPLLTCVDGSEAKVTRGLRVPVRNTVTTNNNTSTTSTSVTHIQTGLEATAKVREVSDTLGRLTLDMTIADVTKIDSEVGPTTKNQAINVTTDVVAGGVYLLGGVRRTRQESGNGAFFTIGLNKRSEGDVWLVFAKTYRIARQLGE